MILEGWYPNILEGRTIELIINLFKQTVGCDPQDVGFVDPFPVFVFRNHEENVQVWTLPG